MDRHVIRLRGPWEFAVVRRGPPGSGEADPHGVPLPSGRITIPDDYSAIDLAARARVEFTRRFGRPTGVASTARVWLVCDSTDPDAGVSLNGELLGAVTAQQARFDVTNRLAERNQLVIGVELPSAAPGEPSDAEAGLLGEIRLEIED